MLSTVNWQLSIARERLILWSPVMMMPGIVAYFRLAREPPLWLGLALLAAAAVLLALARRYAARPVAAALFLVALGFAAAQFRAHQVATPMLSHPLEDRMVEGVIDEIDPADAKVKLVIGRPQVEGLAPAETPQRIRIGVRHDDPDLQVGDRVRFYATLFPLPSPDLPGGYDFARHFYFRSIGAVGFAYGRAHLSERAARSDFSTWLGNLRRIIGDGMRAAMPPPVGAVAAAMTVGQSGPIPGDVKADLRDAGLAHMLAIAGLHLGIAAGVVFFAVRLLLSLWLKLALRLPVKKIAAALALMSAFIYLLLAGCPVPAERAFIMVTVLFSAVLLDRRAITLRTLAIAAFLILLIFPESLLGPSFQLSFAATLAIVSFYERFGRALWRPHSSLPGKVFHHALAIACTSLAATPATAPFILYHFNRFAIFGLLANMVVIPLATFLIMPGIVLSLLLMPLGWQQIGYWPLEWGTRMMLIMAAWVTSLPYAALFLPAPTDAGLIVAAFGLLWLCLTPGRKRLLGLPLIIAGVATLLLQQPYDVLVSADGGKVALRLPDGRFAFLRGRPSSFDGQAWLRWHGQKEALLRRDLDNADCDKTRCIVTSHRQRIAVQLHKGKTAGLCNSGADIIIASDALQNCGQPKLLMDGNFLRAHGATGLRLGNAIVVESAENGVGMRPWSVASP
ncbi:MAG: ComEC/Rec2 family competence protein [Pseudomonadota bacterium]|nr:ComEC/Rec2 family competence protein [Pseudomonadota bacterium]